MHLAYNNIRIGALILQSRPGQTFSQGQTDFIAAVSLEIGLAMALVIAYPRQVAQVRLAAQLDERRRITYELHNSLAQQIGFLHLALDRVAGDDALVQNSRLQSEVEQLRIVAGEAYERVRSILSLERAQPTTDLPRAIADYADSISRRSPLAVDVVTHGEPAQVSLEWSEDVLSFVREGLSNVEKHAHASRVQVELNWSADNLRLTLTDDGVGFDSAATPANGHYGLTMMVERTVQLHGDLKIESLPGNGTRLHFTLPLPRRQTADRTVAPPTRGRP